MKVTPLADRILVKQEKTEAKSAGGLYIPDTAQDERQTLISMVVAVGPGTEKEKITVSVGQKVMHTKYAGTSFKIDGIEHFILKIQDTIAIVE
jgi:chaperonin GroES